MNDAEILVVGGTGMLGRPVVRRLVAEDRSVRVLVRDVEQARRQLPEACDLVVGDLRDGQSIVTSMRGVAAVYANLAEPMARRPPRSFDPERDGTAAIVNAARQTGVRRVLRISAMGVDDFADHWWAAGRKAEADRILRESDLEWTIFRPTWFMESLATMIVRSRLISFKLGSRLRWIAGDDYAAQVLAAIDRPEAVGRTYHPQGPEAMTILEASRRFAAAFSTVFGRSLRVTVVPAAAVRAGGIVSGRMHYLHHLLRMTQQAFARLDAELIPTDLPLAHTTVEQYVQKMQKTGDVPKKT